LNNNSSLEELIAQIAKLPGLGPRSARRIVLHMLRKRQEIMPKLSELITACYHDITECAVCHNLDSTSPCNICTSQTRNEKIICIVESVGDLWALERNKTFYGKYHILGGLLDIIKGMTPDKLNITSLIKRVEIDAPDELIIALPSTLEGQTTSFYLFDILRHTRVKVSRIANGIPLGADLDYMDEGTIAHAINSRMSF
jgi:recombination protein RecR